MVRDPAISTTYCILDGLDECDDASIEVLLKEFKALYSTTSKKSPACSLNLIVFSRALPGLIPDLLSSFPHIRLDPDAAHEVNQDIQHFIDVRVDELSTDRQYPERLIVHVKDVLRKRAQGTFLWVGIVAKMLRKYKVTDVENALDLFPPGLDELYARMLLQIDDDRKEIAARILLWVVMAVRPLTLSELSAAIGTTERPAAVAFSPEEIIRDQVSYCGYFLNIKEDAGSQHQLAEVTLIHYSAKEYLQCKTRDLDPKLEFYRIREDTGNLTIARRCLDCLESGGLLTFEHALDTVGSESYLEVPSWYRYYFSYLQISPFLLYAILHWPEHARCLARTDDVFNLARPFYRNTRIRKSWFKIYCSLKMGRHFAPQPLAPLHLASYFGSLPLAENIISKKKGLLHKLKLPVFLRRVDNNGKTPLIWAFEKGHESIIRLLLDMGTNIEARDNDRARANIESRDNYYGETALIFSARCGDGSLVGLLLDRGANIEAKSNTEMTALISAADKGHRAIVRLLLNRGAHIEAKDNYWKWTALFWAACSGHEPIVQLLLDRGANIEAKDPKEKTPLILAAQAGQKAVVLLLLEKGANIEAKDSEFGWTAQKWAADLGRTEIVQLLKGKETSTAPY